MRRKPQPQITNKKIVSTIKLPFSHKGSPATNSGMPNIISLIVRDSSGQVHLNILGLFGISPEQASLTYRNISNHLPDKNLPRIFKSDSQTINTKEEIKTAEETLKNICNWLGKFRGVATKYLQNYWTWYAVENEFELATNSEKKLFNLCVSSMLHH